MHVSHTIYIKMNYYSQALNNKRWGIYQEETLLATIGCHKTCQRILTLLKANKSKNKRMRNKQDFYTVKPNNKPKTSSKSRNSKTKQILRSSSLV